MFVDYAVIDVAGGVGGSGAEAWRRETFVPRGGPSGGTGGRGGDVVLRADPQLTTLLDYRYQTHYRAERGQHGQGKNRTGRDGESLVLRVPPGTVVRDAESGELIAELVDPGQEVVVAKGGRGGRGNASFATPTNQAPTYWEPGGEGEERRIALELKLIADVGLVGKPNAGKSTLLAAVSAATPKIADYPFTTLAPNLGVVQLSGHRTFVMADIPGIIEGAHEGRGLGLRFLRHIERTRTLAFLVPLDAEDLQAEYDALRQEVSAYSAELASKPHCVVLTKADLLPPGDVAPPPLAAPDTPAASDIAAPGTPAASDAARPGALAAPDAWGVFTISAVARRGLDELLEALWARTQQAAREAWEPDPEEEWRP